MSSPQSMYYNNADFCFMKTVDLCETVLADKSNEAEYLHIQ